MQVQEIMTVAPVSVERDASLETALRLMDEYAIRHLPVVDGERLVGVVSNRDLIGATGWNLIGPEDPEDGAEPAPRTVHEVMQHDPVTVDPTDQLVAAAVEVSTRAIGCLPVVEDEKLVGIVSEMDLIRMLASPESETSVWDEAPTVRTIASFPVSGVSPEITHTEIDSLMQAKGIRHVPVMDGDRLVGMVSDRDMRRASGAGLAPNTPVVDFMTQGVETVHEDTSLMAASSTMSDRSMSALIVTTEVGELGILTTTDVLEYSLDRL